MKVLSQTEWHDRMPWCYSYHLPVNSPIPKKFVCTRRGRGRDKDNPSFRIPNPIALGAVVGHAASRLEG